VWLFAAFSFPFALPLCVLVFRMRSLGAAARAPFAEGLLGFVFVSSILLQAGTYGLVRFGMTVVPGGVRLVSPYMIAACALGALAGAVAAIRQKDFGSMVLFGSVSLFTSALVAAFMLTPRALTLSVVLQIVQSVTTSALLFAATAGHGVGEPDGRHGLVRSLLVLAPLAIAIAAVGFRPSPLLARLETSVARVILRVSPEYAPQVADCLSQPATPPDPAETGLPAGMVIAAPCADGQDGSHEAKK
jgi:NADH:ubiquinone oxidoreductase subunit 4 (subunit M)